MKKKQKNIQEAFNQLIINLKNDYERWNCLHEYGGQDPFWSDGVNMELVRKHIIIGKGNIKVFAEKNNLNLPEIYHKDIPPEVPSNYMAREEEIRKNAIKKLELMKQDKNLQYLKEKVSYLTGYEQKVTSIKNVINYEVGLQCAIQNNDIVIMRRWQYDDDFKSFKNCRIQVENHLSVEGYREEITGQLCLF